MGVIFYKVSNATSAIIMSVLSVLSVLFFSYLVCGLPLKKKRKGMHSSIILTVCLLSGSLSYTGKVPNEVFGLVVS